MAELVNLGAWIEGEGEAQDLIFELADAITTAKIPDNPITKEKFVNTWTKEFDYEGDLWVTYNPTKSSVQGVYKHTDGNTYDVYNITRPTVSNMVYDEVKDAYKLYTPGKQLTSIPTTSSTSVTFGKVTYTDVTKNSKTVDLEGQLCVFIPKVSSTGYTGHIVQQCIPKLDEEYESSSEWDNFVIVGELPVALTNLYEKGKIEGHFGYTATSASPIKYDTSSFNIIPRYSYSKLSYTATTQVSQKCVVLKSVPNSVPGASIEPTFVLLEQPTGDYNHITVRYGRGCVPIPFTGNTMLTYTDACDPSTVKLNSTPKVINQLNAHRIYTDWNDNSVDRVFVPHSISWGLDYDGVTQLVSPITRFFYGRDTSISWLASKKRRPDYSVNYYLSVTNDRVLIVLEGDPSPSINNYYRSFGYIGKIVPLSDTDHTDNFGITCGMGDLETSMTGFTLSNISEKLNKEYSKWGEYTSNGMYSFSMYNTKSKVKYQAYYPAFLTHLPNYTDVGTIPPHLSSLILDEDGFQPSIWTDRYHVSPIYLVHQAEGYRGYMDGVVAIHDHSIVNLDELLVDTEIPKDNSDPSKGNYIEVYKFFSLRSPVNMFKHSPAPDAMSIAIIKNIE